MKTIKRFTSMILALGVLFAMGTVSVFAAEDTSIDGNIYFVASQNCIAKVNTDQYNEIVGGTSLQAVATRDNLQFQQSIDARAFFSGEVNEVNTVSSNLRATGSWTISSNTIGTNSQTYYSKPDGSKFSVAATEYIEMRVKPTTVRSFDVGYTGTPEGLFYAYTEQAGQTAVIAFIDDITVPGSYKTIIGNSGSSSLTVSGSVSVKKR